MTSNLKHKKVIITPAPRVLSTKGFPCPGRVLLPYIWKNQIKRHSSTFSNDINDSSVNVNTPVLPTPSTSERQAVNKWVDVGWSIFWHWSDHKAMAPDTLGSTLVPSLTKYVTSAELFHLSAPLPVSSTKQRYGSTYNLTGSVWGLTELTNSKSSALRPAHDH